MSERVAHFFSEPTGVETDEAVLKRLFHRAARIMARRPIPNGFLYCVSRAQFVRLMEDIDSRATRLGEMVRTVTVDGRPAIPVWGLFVVVG